MGRIIQRGDAGWEGRNIIARRSPPPSYLQPLSPYFDRSRAQGRFVQLDAFDVDLQHFADGGFYWDTREPCIASDIAAVTLAATNKALYPVSNFPVLGGQYFARLGKKLRIRLFGRITTALTPGNLTLAMLYGTGADANGVSVVASAAQTLIASQTNLSWFTEQFVHCRSIGSAGTLFGDGHAFFNTAVIAAGDFIIPASAPAVSGAVDLTAALIPSIQALRSGSTAETMQVHDMEVVATN